MKWSKERGLRSHQQRVMISFREGEGNKKEIILFAQGPFCLLKGQIVIPVHFSHQGCFITLCQSWSLEGAQRKAVAAGTRICWLKQAFLYGNRSHRHPHPICFAWQVLPPLCWKSPRPSQPFPAQSNAWNHLYFSYKHVQVNWPKPTTSCQLKKQ